MHDSDLVISGAGSHGITEAAALRKLATVIRWRRVGGASAGAVNAVNAAGLAFGFTPTYMANVWRQLLTSGKLEDWKYPGPFKPLGMLQGDGGCMRGAGIRAALDEVFTSATMGEAFLPLRIKVGSMLRGRTETISSDNPEHKQLRVTDVVMCSLAVPVLIDNQRLRSTTPADIYCDGGLGDNVPAALWDDTDELGVRPTTVLRFVDGVGLVPVDGLRARVRAFVRIMRDASEDERSSKPKALVWDVPIQADGDGFDFALTPTECDRRERFGDLAGAAWIAKAQAD